jgi:prepilin-type processing-associated H-X9-DG protein
VAIIEAFICPSDGNRAGTLRNSYAVNSGVWPGALRGGAFDIELGRWSGFGSQRDRVGRGTRDITDGTANSAAFSEMVGGANVTGIRDTLNTPWMNVPNGGQNPSGLAILQRNCDNAAAAGGRTFTRYDSKGSEWIFYRVHGNTVYNHGRPPNRHECLTIGDGRPRQDGGRIWGLMGPTSRHPGGVNVLMADGTVRNVSATVDLDTWMAIGTIGGGEKISNTNF